MDTMTVIAAAPAAEFILVVLINAVLAMLIFRHAYRRNNRHATAWGVATFLAAGLAIPVYFFNYWLNRRRA